MGDNIIYPFLDLCAVNAPFVPAINEAVARVVAGGRYIGGPEVEAFEAMLAEAVGVRYAVGVSNGLDALRLIFRAYMALGRLAPGDEVIVPADTYIASVLAVTDCGLTPVFVDPDPHTYNLTGALVAAAATPRTRAVLTVHLYGRAACDAAMCDLAGRLGLLLIEDNAQAIGARCADGRRTGAVGHAAAFSFYPTKNIGAMGDAGAVTTDDADVAAAVRAIANYGSDRRYHNIYVGLNCRLDPVQAAVLAVKLPYTDTENALRADNAAVYLDEIDNRHVRLPSAGADGLSVWHQFVVAVDDRDAFREYLAARGVATDVNYPLPPHRQPCYAARYGDLHLPVADEIARTVVSLPVAPRSTTPTQARRIARIINEYHR